MDSGDPDPDSDHDLGFCSGWAPCLAFPAPIPSPAPRRLSSVFSGSNRPLPSARKSLVYVSLQGRLVGAEEATSAEAVGLSGREEIAAWQLFSPIQRVILVAVVGVAVAESKKNRIISQLRKSVEVRDQILSSMQQKLDNLCGQVHNAKKQPGSGAEVSPSKNAGLPLGPNFQFEETNFGECGCWLCDQHQKMLNGRECNAATRTLQGNPPLLDGSEQEERRLSDLSDWASSVTSSVDIQMDALAMEQDMSNLRRECEEKDVTIRELTEYLHSSDAAGSERIAELEGVIRRKNTIITKLKKDMATLEQKVVQLTRLQRASSQKEGDDNFKRCPFMAENIIYDMDSTTGPSSDDSDCSPASRSHSPVAKLPETGPQSKVTNLPESGLEFPVPKLPKISTAKVHHASGGNQYSKSPRAFRISTRRVDRPTVSQPGSPLREISTNQKPSRNVSTRSRQLHSGSGDSKRSKAKQTQTPSTSKPVTPLRRWA